MSVFQARKRQAVTMVHKKVYNGVHREVDYHPLLLLRTWYLNLSGRHRSRRGRGVDPVVWGRHGVVVWTLSVSSSTSRRFWDRTPESVPGTPSSPESKSSLCRGPAGLWVGPTWRHTHFHVTVSHGARKVRGRFRSPPES